MEPKTYAELVDELNVTVRSDGLNGKTTAEDVRTYLTSFIKELTAKTAPEGDIKLQDSATISLTQDSLNGAIRANLLYSSTAEITLKVNISKFGGLQAELTPSIRNALLTFIEDAKDNCFLFYSAGKTYAFAGAAAAVAYVKRNGLTGLFVFSADVTEPLELLHNCTYDITGFDSVVNSNTYDNTPNIFATSVPGGVCHAILKIRRIIRTGNVKGTAVSISGKGTEIKIYGDTLIDSSNTMAFGISINGAKLHYRGNVEAKQRAGFAVHQNGIDSITEFVGNILTNTTSICTALHCQGGIFNFTGRIDVLGFGRIAICEPMGDNKPWLRLDISAATSKDQGLVVNAAKPFNTIQSQLYVKGLIDLRESRFSSPQDACGLLFFSANQIDIWFENLTILTKPNVPPVDALTTVTTKTSIFVIGKLYTTRNADANRFLLNNVTSYSTP